MLDGLRFKMTPLPEDQYFRQETEKHAVVLHHTGSGGSPAGDVNWWKQTKSRIATCVIIGRDGTVYQLFSSRYWGYHIGAKHPNNSWLQRHTIGVELDNWGKLTDTAEGLKAWNGALVSDADAVYYEDPYRGGHFYERYTEAQIGTLTVLLLYSADY